MLMTHYREPIDFSVARLEEATNLLDRWERFARDATPAAEVDAEALAALADDLNTPEAIKRLGHLISEAPGQGLAVAGLLGLSVVREQADDAGIDARVEARLAALTAKDFATADAIRSELAEAGVALMDYKDETGERKTRWEIKR
jgi:cysteinyl-tRNA synthetase